MSDDIIVKLKDDGDYPLDVEATLSDLTGAETATLEEYLGGWENFDIRGGSTRSVIAIIWLAKRQAGRSVSLEQVAEIKGLIFGDAFDMQEVNGGPPAEAGASPASTDQTSEHSGAGVSKSDME